MLLSKTREWKEERRGKWLISSYKRHSLKIRWEAKELCKTEAYNTIQYYKVTNRENENYFRKTEKGNADEHKATGVYNG